MIQPSESSQAAARTDVASPSRTIVLVTVGPSPALNECIDALVGDGLTSDLQLIVATAAVFPSSAVANWETRGVHFISIPGATNQQLRARAMAAARGHVITWRDDRQVGDPRWMSAFLQGGARRSTGRPQAEAHV